MQLSLGNYDDHLLPDRSIGEQDFLRRDAYGDPGFVGHGAPQYEHEDHHYEQLVRLGKHCELFLFIKLKQLINL